MTPVSYVVRTALAALTLATFAGCTPPSDPQSLIAKAQAHRQNGNYQAAIIELKNVLQKNPEHAEARYLLGMDYLEAGDPRLAESELRRALKLGVDPGKTLPSLAKSLFLQGKLQEALNETDPAAVPAVQSSPEMLNIRGLTQLFMKNPGEAKRSFDQSLALRPDNIDALLGHARLAAGENKLGEAVRLTERAIASDSRSPEAWLMRGDLARAAGDHQGAVTAYQKVVDVRPNHLAARLNIATAQITLGNYDLARKEIDLVRKHAPNSPMANYLQAMIDFRQKNYRAAREAVLKVLKVAPTHMPSVLLAGAVEYELGAQGQAQLNLAKVIDRVPDNLYARKLLVASLSKSGQIQRAIEVLQAGLKQAPQDSALWALAGELYMQNNELGKAIQFFEKAVKLDPKNASNRTGLALSRLASGETDHGMADLEFAVQLDAEKYQADILLVTSHLKRQNYDGALKAMAGLEKKQPDNPLTHNLKAAIYIAKKDVAAARKHLERALVLQPTYVAAAANLARLDLDDKQPLAARRRFEAILEQDKGNTQALLALAQLGPTIRATQKEQIDWLERARKSSPGSVQPSLMLARVYAQAGDVKKALEAAQEAQANSSDDIEVLGTLGAIQLSAGEKNGALTTYGRLASLQPKSPLALYRLAEAQAANGNPAAASTLRKALALKPDYNDAQVALVALELRAGNVSEALKIAQQAQKQAPKAALGFILEGDVLMSQEKFAQAARAYENAYGLSKSGLIVIKLHGAYVKAGKAEEGDARLAQWLKGTPDDSRVRKYAAEANLKSGQFKSAIEQYEWLLRQQPDNVITLNNLAWAYHQVKDPRALETVERAYKLRPDNAGVADTLGWMLVQQGNLKRGIDLLQNALASAPNAHDIRYHLAHALAKSGEKAQAIAHLERIAAADGKFPEQADALALLKQLRN